MSRGRRYRRLTTEEFIQDCKDNRLDFDDYIFDYVNYVNAKTKVDIRHKNWPNESWMVRPRSFSKAGVKPPKLSNNSKLTTEEFIEKCKEARDDFDDYIFDYVNYINTDTKVDIRHKNWPNESWMVLPRSFSKRGVKTPKLSNNSKLTTEEFIDRCKDKRVDFDDYIFDYVNYVNANTKVDIRHKNWPNESWMVRPSSFKDDNLHHPKLGINGGWTRSNFNKCCKVHNKKGQGIMYLIHFKCKETQEEFCKVGITSRSIKKRFIDSQYKHLDIVKYTSVISYSDTVYNLEKDLLKQYRDFKYTPNIFFVGHTECFNLSIFNSVKDYITKKIRIDEGTF